MKKIISLFKRDYAGNRQVYDEVVPGAEWVVAGEGRATEKHDGTCCLWKDGRLWKRYTVKKKRTPPSDFEPATDLDPKTGKQEGWVPVGDDPGDKWHRRAVRSYPSEAWVEGQTYELVGPKVQGNPYDLPSHELWRHGCAGPIMYAPRSFGLLRAWLEDNEVEGIVWHHEDGRMVKIKRKDFGIPWPPRAHAGEEEV